MLSSNRTEQRRIHQSTYCYIRQGREEYGNLSKKSEPASILTKITRLSCSDNGAEHAMNSNHCCTRYADIIQNCDVPVENLSDDGIIGSHHCVIFSLHLLSLRSSPAPPLGLTQVKGHTVDGPPPPPQQYASCILYARIGPHPITSSTRVKFPPTVDALRSCACFMRKINSIWGVEPWTSALEVGFNHWIAGATGSMNHNLQQIKFIVERSMDGPNMDIYPWRIKTRLSTEIQVSGW